MRGAGLAFFAGLLTALGQAPWGLWPLTLAGLALAAELLRRAPSARRAAFQGWCVGAVGYALSMHWIVEPFFVEPEIFGWMAPFALIGLAGGLALFWAAAFWGAARLGTVWALVPALTLAELARGYVLTGFPWNLLGYVWIDTPVAQSVAVFGAYGLTAVTVLLAVLCLQRWRGAVGAALLLALLWGAGLWRMQAPGAETDTVVRLVQPNAPQHLKWDPAHTPTFFGRQIAATRAQPRPDLIVWPETAVPILLDWGQETLDVIAGAADGVPVVLGLQRQPEGAYFNSAVLLDEVGEVAAIYDKHHLVPFGEYLPLPALWRRFGLSGLAENIGAGFAAGPGAQLMDLGSLGRALPLICYEAVFPQDVRAAPERPDFLLHLTNDAWFGQRAGPQQHLVQARFRAIEQGLPLARAANTGISAMIDPLGRVTAALGLGKEGHLDAALPAPLPPTLYARAGDLPVLLAMLAALAALWADRVRRRSY